MSSGTVWAVAGLWLALGLAGCGSKEEKPTGEVGTTISLVDDEYRPSAATAKVGDVYKFVNQGARTHTVTIHRPPAPETELLKDIELKPGKTTFFEFQEDGTYHVWCKYHGRLGARMHLDVTVQAASP